MGNILEIRDLFVRFYTYEGIVKAIEGVNLDLKEGETLGLVGETGCGKSVTSLSTLMLVPPPGRIEGGRIFFKKGKKKIDMVQQKEEDLQKIRGKDISMIFQEPSAALDPVYTVSDQIAEAIMHHRREEMYMKAFKQIEDRLKKE
ncbi:ABC transporter ATP-binding protein, partial [Candidatus Bathyarchaeota archaeon]